MTIEWSNKSLETYEDIIDDLIKLWNPDIAQNFEDRTRSLLDRLKKNNKLCPVSNFQSLRKCVIHSNVSMIYRL